MTVLRSREVLPKSPSKTLKKPPNPMIQLSTPLQIHRDSEHCTPPAMSLNLSVSPSAPSYSNGGVRKLGSGSSSVPGRKRSLRLASKLNASEADLENGRSQMNDGENGENLNSAEEEERKGRDSDGWNDSKSNSESDLGEEEGKKIRRKRIARVSDSPGKKARFSESFERKLGVSDSTMEQKQRGRCEERSVKPDYDEESHSESQVYSGGNQLVNDEKKEGTMKKSMASSGKLVLKIPKRSGRLVAVRPKERRTRIEADKGADDRKSMNLRSGARIVRRGTEVTGVDCNENGDAGTRSVAHVREVGIKDEECQDKSKSESGDGFSAGELETSPIGDGNGPEGKRRKVKEEGKGEMVESGSAEVEKVIEPILNDSSAAHCGRRYRKEEKGKGKEKLVSDDQLSLDSNFRTLDVDTVVEFIEENIVEKEGLNISKTTEEFEEQEGIAIAKQRARGEKERRENRNLRKQWNRESLRAQGARFAYFKAEEEHPSSSSSVSETEVPLAKDSPEIDDWPGPFSTATRIIEERSLKLKARLLKSRDKSKNMPGIYWTPSKTRNCTHSTPLVPSLKNLCINVLSKNAEEIGSLEGVPDAIRNKLCQLLCDSRKMGPHVLDLLLRGSPSEVCIKDTSCITEDQLRRSFVGCNTDNLRVLQLDLCGRCISDYILRDTLAQTPNSFPALTTVSLRGAFGLTDNGLNSLITSAPLLSSINLGQCPLLTSTGINSLANNLESILRELYIDECHSIDAMLILPALKKVKNLEVLSVAGIQTVCDKFVRALISVCGSNMKELVFSDCGNLTDASLKVIGDNCPGLRALNIVNLRKLTDSSMQYIANGCRSIQVLKLRRNGFSDEAIAAYLVASGESLRELSLNNVKEVANNTAMAIADQCQKTLQSLDVSWCRELMDEALGLIVDKCSELRLLKLFGCTQITNVFLEGHSNSNIKIIGLRSSPILEHLDVLDSL